MANENLEIDENLDDIVLGDENLDDDPVDDNLDDNNVEDDGAHASEEDEAGEEEETETQEQTNQFVVKEDDRINDVLEAVNQMKLDQTVSKIETDLRSSQYLRQVLEKQLDEAVESGDTAAVRKVNAEMVRNELAITKLEAQKESLTSPQAVQQREMEREAKAFMSERDSFMKRNDWYAKDDAQRSVADALFDGLLAQGKTHRQALKEVESRMAGVVGKKVREAKKAPVKPQNVAKPVAAKTAGAFTYGNLKDDVKKEFEASYSILKRSNPNLDKKAAWGVYKQYLNKDSYKVQ